MAPPATAPYDWILAITSIAFTFSAFGNGANDVANSFATSVAARTLTMAQAGLISMVTEFVGAVALGSRVTSTIKNGIFSIDHFNDRPGALMVVMGCAEIGSATWLMVASGFGMPVSTTHTIVGALTGAGIASQASIKWSWQSGSLSQIAASWAIAPILAGCFSAIIFASLKYTVLERKESLKWAMRLIPLYIAFTASILALFIVIELPTAPSLEEFGAGKAVGIILGVFFGVLVIAMVFFKPYFYRRIIRQDSRIKYWHLPLGPLLWRDNAPLYFPGQVDGEYVKDYYADPYQNATYPSPPIQAIDQEETLEKAANTVDPGDQAQSSDRTIRNELEATRAMSPVSPRQRFLDPVSHLKITHPRRLFGYIKFILLQGVTRDCVTHDSTSLRDVHARASKYDIRVEHLWTYCQVASAMIMSIAHGSNDVANAVGPWAASYQTYKDGVVSTRSPTPVWFLVIAGFLLGAGFWFYGFHVVRSLGNKITRMSPTRGYSVELGAAITVLLASRLSLPVSTTQCLTGSVLGVALMNFDLRATNWKQVAFIFSGWVLTLPCSGLISGLLCVMALNAPSL
ncbi:PiT family inorganic phosphate transporter [Exophiala aquamarina CBS 119918]|uniref:Phosphate transporter n=1 Tax=Exophiala aquamarina CBS 119918 TaxID=1182545 RepID=A0A072NVJ5_9EURO|nr:PiT family inorganic phosphate transporter [Exophiala aquamarina CBS 119918]KEF51884.1 PiT family inorganic phosphate transporter [Exophiala aquamarina CBS 119918]